MKFIFAAALFLSCAYTFAQKPDEILATSNVANYTVQSLSAEGRKIYENRDKLLADARTRLLSEMIAETLIDFEAKAQGRTVEQLLTAERSKAAAPTQSQLQAFYDENRSSLANKTFDEVRDKIAEYLRAEAEQKAVETYVQGLQAKYKFAAGKDVNAFGLKPTEMLVTVGTKAITVQEFEDKNKFALYDARAEIYDEVRSDLESSIFSALAAEEAKTRGTDLSSLIGTEITDKLREYTDEERAGLERAFLNRLYTKYSVKFLLKEPEPLVQNVSIDDDPVLGSTAAPVTVVMFTDYQCPACSKTHPVLKKVVAEFGDKVRLVLRDFPLQKIHPNSFQAAIAANAARAQGKFAEYIEVLYRNQDALDRASLVKYAADLGLNTKKFELDLSDEKLAAEIRKDIADGTSYGASGTPTIFVNGVKVRRISADGFRTAIERALKK
jgi:protein-disulfide isomerase